MTNEQTSRVPEELYNLTQLADLAASRLSNAHKLKSSQQPEVGPSSGPIMNIHGTFNIERDDCRRFEWRSAPAQLNSNDSGNSSALNKSPAMATHAEGLLAPPATVYSSSDEDSNYYSHKVFDRKKLRRSTISYNSSASSATSVASLSPSTMSCRYDEHSCSSLPSCSGDDLDAIGASKERRPDCLKDGVSDGAELSSMDDEHVCPECGKKYSTSSNLARHRQTHRSIMDKKARRCPHCEKVYVSMPAFSMHVRTHNQGCRCDFCGKCFSRPWLLQGHLRTHTGEKPFKCVECGKAFADKSNLRAHIQTHSNTKPHTCSRCGKAFALKSYLYKHEESSCLKHHQRDKDGRPAATNSKSSHGGHKTTKPKTKSATSAPLIETTKSTLATKLLRRKAHAHAHAHAIAQSIDYEQFKRISVIQPTQMPSAIDLIGYPECLTIAPMMPVATTPADVVASPLQFYQPLGELANASNATGPSDGGQPQDQPMDYSPKNNFSHSSKTSPFEMTANYAILA